MNDAPSAKRIKLSKLESKSHTEIVESLSPIFHKIEQSHNITIDGQSSLPTIPGLHIKDIGHIPLPICDEQISKILSLYLRSSNDDDINKSYLALEPSKFYLSHPNWNKSMLELIKSVALSLGVHYENIPFIEAHLRELIIFNVNGCFVDNNNDKKKLDERCFATLIVQIPSNYKVINNEPILIAKHQNEIFQHDFGANNGFSPFATFFAAYYNDMELKHNQIAKGHRICIIYNLCWKGQQQNMPNIDMITKSNNNIDDILQRWDGNECIAVGLKYQYKHNQLYKKGINGLKQTDFNRISILMETKSAKMMNFAIFIAKMDEHRDNVSNEWFTENGDIFQFGKYFTVNLNKDCICYYSHDDGGDLYWKQSEYIKNKDRYIVIVMRDCLQFNMIARNSMFGAIQWVKNVVDIDKNKDILIEMTEIVKTSTFEDIHKSEYKQIVDILKLLQQKSYYELVAHFVDNQLIPNHFGFHGQNTANTRYWRRYNDIEDTSELMDIFGAIISKYGWNEPIKTSVLNMINCIQYANNKQIYQYCNFINVLKQKNCVSVGNEKQREVMICGYIRCQATKKQFKCIPDDVMKIINTMYGVDCCQDIADKIWMNIIDKFENENEVSIDAKTIVSIYELIVCYQWNKQKRKEMKDLFDKIYDLKVKQDIKPKFVAMWTENVLMYKDKSYFNETVDLLINKFDSLYNKYRVDMINKILTLLNLDQFIEFVNTKLIHHNITRYDVNQQQIKSIHYNHYYHRSTSIPISSPNEYKMMIENIANLITKNPWNESLQSAILNLMDSINIEIGSGIKACNILLEQIKKYQTMKMNLSNLDKDEDDDIIILTNHDQDKCLKDITMRIWKNITENVDKNKKELTVSNIVMILEFMANSFDSNDKTQQEMYQMFDNIYFQNFYVPQEIQKNVISKIRSWENKWLFSSICIQNVFRHRIRYLSTLREPTFSWKMLENMTITISDNEFTEFLKSERKSIKKFGFNNIKEARKWSPTPYNTQYFSVTLSPEGRGKSAYVLVTKNKDYYNKHCIIYQQHVAELNDLLSILN